MILEYNKTSFQGKNRRKNTHYFEGWYYKQVSGDEGVTLSFIPGISYNDEDPHAFIQCIYKDRNNHHQTFYFRYVLEAFHYKEHPFEVRIGKCFFSKETMHIHLEQEGMTIEGTIRFGPLKDLKRTLISPNIMGYFNYIPQLECRHEVVSMTHWLEGYIQMGEEIIDFTYGKGYIEKDWGQSFPEKYLWIQTNHFPKEDMSFCCSIATVPVFGTTIEGFFANLVIGDEQYRFATYNGSKVIILPYDGEQFRILMKNKKYTLKIRGRLTQGEALVAPSNGRMSYTIREALTTRIEVVLKEKNNRILLKTEANVCGIENVGYLNIESR